MVESTQLSDLCVFYEAIKLFAMLPAHRILPYFQRSALVVRDLDRALLLYRDLLGFRLEYLGTDTPDAYSYELFRIPRHLSTRFATLSSAQQQRTLALIEVPDYQGVSLDSVIPSAIVVQVATLGDVLKAATTLGLQVQTPRTTNAPPARTEAGFYDTDGHLVVVYELLLVAVRPDAPPVTQKIPSQMRQWTLQHRPKGLAQVSDFRLETAPVPSIGPGQLLVQTQYLGVAPVMLRYMNNETSFERPLQLGDVMHGRGVGRVIASQHPYYQVGDYLQAKLGWREYALIAPDDPYFMVFRMNHPDLPISHGISTLAMSGFTALVGLQEICQLKASDRVLVSGAAGGVGSQVAFVAKALGATQVVGMAGGATKCQMLTQELGYTDAIDYKTENVTERLDELFPEGIDVFFDNVGGEILDGVMGRIRRRGRIAICGRISEYLKQPEEYHRPRNLWKIGLRDAKLEAFFVYDYTEHFGRYEKQLAAWIREDKLQPKEDILEGIELVPEALISLYRGDNIGVRMVRIDPTAR
jgi:NADPH-dependent curcumin reductase